jgi:hypothetical protein
VPYAVLGSLANFFIQVGFQFIEECFSLGVAGNVQPAGDRETDPLNGMAVQGDCRFAWYVKAAIFGYGSSLRSSFLRISEEPRLRQREQRDLFPR